MSQFLNGTDFAADFAVGKSLPTLETGRSRKAFRRLSHSLRSRRLSANLLVDLNGTCQMAPSLQSGNGVSGQVCGLSGVYVGQSVDLLNANTYCNVYVQGLPALSSGNLLIGVQVSDTDVSGLYADPNSGLAQFPTVFQSGGVIWINSGSTGGLYQSGGYSGAFFNSGFFVAAAFQRTARYARLVFNSGFYIGQLTAGFISQNKTTGSGGGFTWSPQVPFGGPVNV